MIAHRRIDPRVAVTVLALVAGACSTDVSRDDPPSFSLIDNAGTPPRPSEPMRSDLSGADSGNLARAVANREASTIATKPREASARAAEPLRDDPVKGETIEVARGDTLFGLAKRHRVSVNELKSFNHLDTATLKPGQRLSLPAPASRLAVSAPKATRPNPSAPAGWEGSYTIKAGDSLYLVALRHKVKLAELEHVNGITNPRRVRPGTVLRVPTQALEGSASASPKPALAGAAPDLSRLSRPAPRPVVLNSGQTAAAAGSSREQTGSLSETPVAATANAEVREVRAALAEDTTSKLRWPVRGRVIAPFGPRADGTHNDGLNIAVPMGTDIHAAEHGVIAYAGDELEGYGKLVLVRHDNGWVTAYAHNSQLLVERGDTVMRGQIIARAGKTGKADQPQLRFELRQSAKPVDPTQFMEAM